MKTIEDAVGGVAGLRRSLEAGGLDAVIAASPENVQWVADVEISTQRSIRDRLAVVIWAKGEGYRIFDLGMAPISLATARRSRGPAGM